MSKDLNRHNQQEYLADDLAHEDKLRIISYSSES